MEGSLFMLVSVYAVWNIVHFNTWRQEPEAIQMLLLDSQLQPAPATIANNIWRATVPHPCLNGWKLNIVLLALDSWVTHTEKLRLLKYWCLPPSIFSSLFVAVVFLNMRGTCSNLEWVKCCIWSLHQQKWSWVNSSIPPLRLHCHLIAPLHFSLLQITLSCKPS